MPRAKENPYSDALAGMQCGLAGGLVAGFCLHGVTRLHPLAGLLLAIVCCLVAFLIENAHRAQFVLCIIPSFWMVFSILTGQFNTQRLLCVLGISSFTFLFFLLNICEKFWRENNP